MKKPIKELDFRQMPIVNQHVASIDIGSRFHMVAIGDKESLAFQPKNYSIQPTFSKKMAFRKWLWKLLMAMKVPRYGAAKLRF